MENRQTEPAINEKRMTEEFARLVEIDCVSFAERAMADFLIEELTELGFSVEEDQAWKKYGDKVQDPVLAAGNLYGYLPGTLPGPPLLFSAHMDTVQPGIGKKAVFREHGRICSDGTTVLGADDAAGLVQILEAVRVLQENHIPHRSIEVLFPIAEEAYVKGSAVFAYDKIQAKEAYVLDLSGPVGRVSLQEPTLISFRTEITGKAAHAGFAPEDGINAIRIAADGICRIPQGRIDEESTLNIGRIAGGDATNIVSRHCVCEGEIRSYSHEKALELAHQVESAFARAAQAAGGTASTRIDVNLTAYRIPESSPALGHFLQACRQIGLEPETTATFGGSDNNNFVREGLDGIVISCGMSEIHTVKEYIEIQDLINGAKLIATLLQIQE